MALFAYRALTTTGTRVRGQIDAESVRAAWHALRTRGIYPTDVESSTTTVATRIRVSDRVLAAALHELATLVDAGVPVTDALASLAAGTVAGPFADAVAATLAAVREGAALGDAMADRGHAFPPIVTAAVRAGEASGNLPEVLRRIADHLDRQATLRSRITSALLYPAIMAATTIGVTGFLVVWVLPQVAQVFVESGTPLPWSTRLIAAAGRAFAATWWLWLAAAGAAVLAVRALVATPRGRAQLDAVFIALPVVGSVLRNAALARAVRALATMLGGGVPLETALPLAGAAAGNDVIATGFGHVRRALQEGRSFADALGASHLANPTLLRLAATGERSGTLATTLLRAADDEDRRLEARLTALTALVEPALVLLMGAVVLLVVATILVPLLGMDPTGAIT